MEVLSFFSGVAFFYFKNGYPLGLACLFVFFRPRFSLFLCFLLGIFWSLAHDLLISSSGMPIASVISHATLTGTVYSIPIQTNDRVQFEFYADSLNQKSIKAKILLSCYDKCPTFIAGQRWQLNAKLKHPQNLGNPGGFNKVQSLKIRHIQWIGYTRPDAFKYLGENISLYTYLLQMRAYFSHHLHHKTLNIRTESVIQALTLGFGEKINPEVWALFRRTGTTHLMVISGAHIGLVAGLIYRLIKNNWSKIGGFAIKIPAQRIASFSALMIAFFYTVLAGFGIPAQRALIVCFFMFFRYFSDLAFSIWQAFRYALLLVILFEPHAVLMPGFYLSFMAVAILIAGNQIISAHKINKILFMQLFCLIGLMPLTLYLFSYGSINGFLANLLAIPWVGFCIIPIGLSIVFLGPYFKIDGLLWLVDKAVLLLFQYLNWVDQFARFNLNYSLNAFSSVLFLMGALIIACFFPIKRFFPIIAVFVVCGLYPRVSQINWGEARIDVLDVAQGLSVVINTKNHRIIYDTGVKFYHGGDMAEMAIIPYLKIFNTKWLDMVIISHPDLDHRGGLSSLEKTYLIKRLLVDDPQFYHAGESCHQYPAWQWDGVFFQFFPLSLKSPKKNDHSCILKITTHFGSMLLTGDIEKTAENDLIQKYSTALKSSYLLVPHHESKTSSSLNFLKKVSPKAAIASYGFDNRYHFPHVKTVSTYKAAQIPVYSTATCGLIQVFLTARNKLKQPKCTKYHK